MTETSSSVAIGVPGVTSEPGLTCRSPRTPSNGAVITRSESCARTTSMRALAASRVERMRVELALGDDLRLREFLAARELALGLLVGRARLLEPGELRAAREVHDHVAGPHQVAAVEADLADRLADFRGQRDRFLRARGPERLDRVAPFDRRDFRGDDDGRGRRFVLPTGRRRHSRRGARPGQVPLPKHENTKIEAYRSSGFPC